MQVDINILEKLRTIVVQYLDALDPPKTTKDDYEDNETPLIEEKDDEAPLIEEEVVNKKFNEATLKLQKEREELGLTDEDIYTAMLLIGCSFFLGDTLKDVVNDAINDLLTNVNNKVDNKFQEFCKNCDKLNLSLDEDTRKMRSILFSKLKSFIVRNQGPIIYSSVAIGVSLVIWNLNKILKSTIKLCKILNEGNKEYKNIFTTNKSVFFAFLQKMKLNANKMIEILELDDSIFDENKFNEFKECLVKFLESTKKFADLFLTMITLCYKITAKLEEQKTSFSNKLIKSTIISGIVLFGGLAVSYGGQVFPKYNPSSSVKIAVNVATVAGTVGVGAGAVAYLTVKRKESCIKRYKAISNQLKGLVVRLLMVEPDLEKDVKSYEEMNSETRQNLKSIICNCDTECTNLVEIFN
ncbi:846_t:CDS:2 [Gigaspora rosea]|nr:846_t:CDS:2 [Gigaspora rosea]